MLQLSAVYLPQKHKTSSKLTLSIWVVSDPLAFALALQFPTSWATKTDILVAGEFVEFILTHEMNETWNKDNVNCGNIKLLNEDMIVAVVIAYNLSRLQLNPSPPQPPKK